MADVVSAAIQGGFVLLGAAIAQGVSLFLHRQKEKSDLAAEARRDAKRLRHLKATLSSDLRTIGDRARQVPGIVKVHKAANADVSDQTKERCRLQQPGEFSNWEAMSLLSDEVLEKSANLTQMIQLHNYDIDRTGGAFGDDNWGPHISKQAEAIAQLSREIAGALRGEDQPAEKRI